jgi:hypothetical protein
MDMSKIIQKIRAGRLSILLIGTLVLLGSCEKFIDPDQDLVVKEDDFFKDWYEYRAAEMGMYGLMQDLAEQLLVLGEVRADLLQVTENASRDLIEVQNFEISEQNRYASPRNFYKLIAACNNLQRKLEHFHPEVLDKDAPITNYDKVYGEVLNMRSWAYFNAVRIYRKIPYIPVSLTSIDEIVEFVNSPKTIVDSIDIIYALDGWHNDTIPLDEPKILENAYLELPDIVDSCTNSILNGYKATGVNHYIDNNDESWEATVWNEYAMYYLLGQMQLHKGDIHRAFGYFKKILYYEEPEAQLVKYGLDRLFAGSSWKNMFTSINVNEHIFVIWFGKSHRQTNNFQRLFSTIPPNQYQLKPTRAAIDYWETIWNDVIYQGTISSLAPHYDRQSFRPGWEGDPGDFARGNLASYAYRRGLSLMTNKELREILSLKRKGNYFEIEKITNGYDTVVYKYTLGKESDPFARDANFIVARAANVHLYAAEINTYYASKVLGDDRVPNLPVAELYVNNGKYRGDNRQLGVRGRVGFSDYDEVISSDVVIWLHDPYTNDIIGYRDFTGRSLAQARYFEEEILKERARELAFEGERFYDLIRIAKRRNDNSLLADLVAAKFPASQRESIRSKLMFEENWYLPFYLGTDE